LRRVAGCRKAHHGHQERVHRGSVDSLYWHGVLNTKSVKPAEHPLFELPDEVKQKTTERMDSTVQCVTERLRV